MDEIEIVPYDPAWPAQFELEAKKIRAAIGSDLLAIEHVGSTAVPGLAAKPVIDIMIALEDRSTWPTITPLLLTMGYLFWEDNPDKSRLFFVKGLPPHASRRTHHVHVLERGGQFDQLLLFRDVLRADSGLARRYEALKYELVARNRDDRNVYTEAKSDFILASLSSRSG